jgi:hypothetical protein
MFRFLAFEETPRGLVITLTPEGEAEIRDNPEIGVEYLLEFQICNGWEYITPEEIGALTDATLLSNSADRDDQGKLLKIGAVYSNIGYYQMEDDVARLLRRGELVWSRCE